MAVQKNIPFDEYRSAQLLSVILSNCPFPYLNAKLLTILHKKKKKEEKFGFARKKDWSLALP
jgi:hypothetical protein